MHREQIEVTQAHPISSSHSKFSDREFTNGKKSKRLNLHTTKLGLTIYSSTQTPKALIGNENVVTYFRFDQTQKSC